MSKNQLTGTATQPQRHRIFCQFNKDQYCNTCVAVEISHFLNIRLVLIKISKISKECSCIATGYFLSVWKLKALD